MALQIAELGLECHTCDAALKSERGCTEQSKVGWYIDNVLYRRCPKKLVPPETWDWLNVYFLFKQGFLPHGIGWINESKKFIDGMIFMDNEMSKIRYEKEKKVQDGRRKT